MRVPHMAKHVETAVKCDIIKPSGHVINRYCKTVRSKSVQRVLTLGVQDVRKLDEKKNLHVLGCLRIFALRKSQSIYVLLAAWSLRTMVLEPVASIS